MSELKGSLLRKLPEWVEVDDKVKDFLRSSSRGVKVLESPLVEEVLKGKKLDVKDLVLKNRVREVNIKQWRNGVGRVLKDALALFGSLDRLEEFLNRDLSENSSLKNVLSEIKSQVDDVAGGRGDGVGLNLFLEKLTSSGKTDLVSEVIMAMSKVDPSELKKFGWFNEFKESFGHAVRLWFLFGLNRVEQEYK